MPTTVYQIIYHSTANMPSSESLAGEVDTAGNYHCTNQENNVCPCIDTEEAVEETVTGKNYDIDELPSDVCGCPCQTNRFKLSFQDTRHLGDICLDESRIKCKAFWEFVDANPKYAKLIKESHKPLGPSKPIRYAGGYKVTIRLHQGHAPQSSCGLLACDDTTNRACSNLLKAHVSKSQEDRCAVVLPIEVKLRSEADRRRLRTRRKAVDELQLKSGQPIIHAKKEQRLEGFRLIYADEVKEPLEFLQ